MYRHTEVVRSSSGICGVSVRCRWVLVSRYRVPCGRSAESAESAVRWRLLVHSAINGELYPPLSSMQAQGGAGSAAAAKFRVGVDKERRRKGN